MEHYIKKSAIMAEIRKYIKSAEAFLKYHHNRNDKSVYSFEQEKLVMCDLLYFIDNLEVKEIDLEKEVDKWYNSEASKEFENVLYKDIEKCAKYFFELGYASK